MALSDLVRSSPAAVSTTVGAVSGAHAPGFFRKLVAWVRDWERSTVQDHLRLSIDHAREEGARLLKEAIGDAKLPHSEAIMKRSIKVWNDHVDHLCKMHKMPSRPFQKSTYHHGILPALEAVNLDAIARNAARFVLTDRLAREQTHGATAKAREVARMSLTWLDLQPDSIPLHAMALNVERVQQRMEKNLESVSLSM